MSTLLDTQNSTRKQHGSSRQTWTHRAILLITCMFAVGVLLVLLSGSLAFGAYWSSGWAAAHGMNPYAAYPLTGRSQIFFNGQLQTIEDINLNPPCLLPLLQAMSHLTVTQFGIAWTIGSVLLLIGSIGLLLRHRPSMQMRQVLWLALAAPVYDTIVCGQIYFLLLFLSALAWICAETKRELASSIALGFLVAIKPTTAFWPLFLFLAGRRKLALRSACVTVAASAIPLAIYGPIVYRQWIDVIRNDRHWIIPTNIAIPAYFARLGLRDVGLGVAAIIAAWLGYVVWKTRPNITTISGIALCAMILCAPLAWYDYALMLTPVFVSSRWGKLETAAAVLLMLPPSSVAVFRLYDIGGAHTVAGLEAFLAVWVILIFFLRQIAITRQAPAIPVLEDRKRSIRNPSAGEQVGVG